MMVGGSGYGGGHHHHSNHRDLADLSFSLSERGEEGGQSTLSLLDSIERRTQRTYRYGIGLVCIGATLNWLGFAQGNSYIDPLRYLGVACVISGSFCVCLAMCRWLGRPISLSGHRVSGLEEESLSSRVSGEVHVINVAVPMFMPSMHEEYRPQKPPDYDIATGEPQPPPYDEAIKLTPGSLFTPPGHPPGSGLVYQPPSSCSPSPSHSSAFLLIQNEGDQKVKSEVNPQGSPPPPYHPSPRRYPIITANSEEEKLLDQRSEEVVLLTRQQNEVSLTPPLALEGQTSPEINLTNSNRKNVLLCSPVILTDANSSSSILNMQDSESNRLLH